MLTIRLNRTGKRNRPYFRVVLQEHTKAPGKRHVEILGSYDPVKKTTVLKKDRISYWLGQGVKASDSVHNLLVRENVIQGKKRSIKIPQPVTSKAEDTKEAPQAETVPEKSEEASGPQEEKKPEEKPAEAPQT